MKKNNETVNWDLLYAVLTSDPDPSIHEQWQQACQENEQYLVLYNEWKPHFELADEPEWADLFTHLDRINRLHQAVPKPVKKKNIMRIPQQLWWAAACILGFSLTAWYIIQQGNSAPAKENKPLTWKRIKGAEGRVTLMHFPDGSVISLSPASILRYPDSFDSQKREVYLTGEAYFNIAKDTSRPFLVHSGLVTTKVTGTSFSVKSDTATGEYEVKLVEGSVSLLHNQAEGQRLLGSLLPQQAFYYSHKNDNWHIEPITAAEAAAIAAGGFVFKNTPLWKIARQLELYYAVEISFSTEAIKQLQFTNIFEKPTLSNILHVIQSSGKVTIVRGQDHIIISPKK